jgi:hypothetical protein
LPGFYAEWVGYSLEEVGSVTGLFKTTSQEGEISTVFERGGNLHMLLLVQKASPTEVPFQNGITYQHIPRMLIPRFIDDQKGSSHTGNILLSVNYGLILPESVNTVSIAWGIIPEAYANFGYTGVAVLAFALAVFYSLASRATVGVPMTSLRFVLGLLFMAAATQADTMGIFVTTQFQGVVGVSMAALVLMRRQANPFAAGGGEAIRQGAEGIRHTAYGRRQETGPVEYAGPVKLSSDSATSRAEHSMGREGKQLSADGGTVRTLPIRMPKRTASWMPRRVRAAVVAAARSAEERGDGGQGTGEAQNGSGVTRERPRQVAVPYQNYRRYRG